GPPRRTSSLPTTRTAAFCSSSRPSPDRMTSARRNGFVLLVVAALVALSALIISTKPTRLGLDLKGGVQLVYQGEPTPQVPKVTPSAIDDAISTIRKRTDALGVSEPEIQRSDRKSVV